VSRRAGLQSRPATDDLLCSYEERTMKYVVGAILGAAIGGAFGYFGKCMGGG
jgi:hypothetical protein